MDFFKNTLNYLVTTPAPFWRVYLVLLQNAAWYLKIEQRLMDFNFLQQTKTCGLRISSLCHSAIAVSKCNFSAGG